MKIPGINRLIRTAKKSNLNRARHATLVLKGGCPIAIGYNHHERHSEVNALQKLWPNKRAGTTIINIRITGAGRLGMSKPCVTCHLFLINEGVDKIFYTDKNGELQQI